MSEPFLAEIRMIGFNFAPRGWAFCDGQILPINQNQALFSLLGTIYGGDFTNKKLIAIDTSTFAVRIVGGTGGTQPSVNADPLSAQLGVMLSVNIDLAGSRLLLLGSQVA